MLCHIADKLVLNPIATIAPLEMRLIYGPAVHLKLLVKNSREIVIAMQTAKEI